tara:strand:+ start:706 stop:1632 length:927 start_codon:yes stop_codon:yes gene_type:complete
VNPPIIYFSNRCESIFDHALQPLGGKSFIDSGSKIDFLYFCTHSDKLKPLAKEITFDLIDRQFSVPLANRSRLARSLNLAGLDTLKTYFLPNDIPKDRERLWFVKNPLSSGGRDIFCVRSEDVLSVFEDGFIIQEGATNLDMIENRKYTIKAYVLYLNGCVYVFNEAIVLVHGKEYSELDVSSEAQYLHAGCEQVGSKVKLECFRKLSNYEYIYNNIKNSISDVLGIFMNTLNCGDKNSYCIFSLDYLVTKALDVLLIEINDRPNLIHTTEINQKVNIPMLQAAFVIMMPSLLSSIQHPHLRFSKLIG